MNNSLETLIIGEDNTMKTLGLTWVSNIDKLGFNINVHNTGQITKRSMLSCISKIFDPLGLVSPTIVLAKVLLQKLWLEKLNWDSSVPYEIRIKWNQFAGDLPSLNDLRISRYVACNNAVRIDLHAFSDASETAYGGAVYVRSENDNGEVFCHLLTSKAKVAPLKPLTTPRLELCAAHLLAKLLNKVTSSSNLTFNSLTCWTDSKVILGWIRTSVNVLKPFVRNRVAEIQDLTEVSSWRYVPTNDNPADILSRGLSASTLKSSELWWHGPRWLKENSVHWPSDMGTLVELPEIRSLFVKTLFDFPFEKFSSLSRLKRCMAFVLRFIHNCSTKRELRTTGVLSALELEKALNLLVKISQSSSFTEEYHDLKSGNGVSEKSKILSLNPFIDEEGILRVGGRLKNSKFDYNKKHPMLLSSKHYLTRLIFEYEHIRLLHAGPQQLLFSVRQRFWPTASRNLARSVVHKCLKCYKLNAKPVQPMMGDLPADRFLSGFPFQVTGIDYAGPFFILNKKGRGSRLLKSYVCLFICFSSKAVHLEIVSDLSSDAFLLALKRFIGRRGKPSKLYSDCGSNFVGANKELKELYKLVNNNNVINDYVNNEGISWHFNPAYAPHFGGLWEAGIKSMKHHLRRVAMNSNFTYEEFGTLLCQVEAILNSRPLSPLSADPHDPCPLTPAHFIIGRPLTSILEPDLAMIKESRLSRYQKIENGRQHFWTRWYKEYVSDLQGRVKWKTESGRLTEGTLVVIKDDKLPPLNWKMGRVVKTFPGGDGIARVAEVRTPTGIIKRDFSKLCPLPLNDTSA